MKYYQDKNKIYFQNLLKQDTFGNIFQKHDNCLTFCSKKSLTSKVGDELRLLKLGEY